MQTSPKRRKSKSTWVRFIVPVLLSTLILLLIIGTVFLVLGSLKIIYWPDELNTVFISIIIPDLGIVIALAQWLHSISSEKKEEQSNLQEQGVQPPISNVPVIPQVLFSTPEKQNSGHGNGVSIHEDEELVDMGEAPHVEHFYGRVDELATLDIGLNHYGFMITRNGMHLYWFRRKRYP